jgi:hypothetical protein
MKLHKLKRIAILMAPLLLYGGAALAATSGTSIDQPITFFGNLIHGSIANLAFLGGSAAAIYSYHHDGFSGYSRFSTTASSGPCCLWFSARSTPWQAAMSTSRRSDRCTWVVWCPSVSC